MPETSDRYRNLCRDYRWSVPEYFNIGVDVCDRHATGNNRPALAFIDEFGNAERYSFDALRELSNRFANVLTAAGLLRGDRVAVLLPQAPETAIAHLAAFKAGMISVPLFMLFGDDALEFRLANSGAKAIVTDFVGLAKLDRVRDRLPDLTHVYVVGDDAGGANNKSFAAELERASGAFTPVNTRAEDPAVIIYTSGTTGNPKGALHAHRVLLGHRPGIAMIHDFFPQPGDFYWTPADWAWIGGLFVHMLCSWHYGVPILAQRAKKFDPDGAMHLMASQGVRNAFLPPTSLKMMRQAGVTHAGVKLRSMLTGGEMLGAEMLDWVQSTFGIAAHECLGQTECNLILGNNANLFPIRPGSVGKPVPGFDVRIVDDQGNELPDGETGNIGVRRPLPIMMLEYWQNPNATAEKYAGEFLMTGDLATRDADGYFWYVSRADDVITSAGYRIGPGEIENCLIRHPAIAMAAAVGIPDPVRTESVKAWVVLRPGYDPSDALARDIQAFVRTELSAHEYPRYVAFAESLPMTVTGKIIRRELRARG